MTGRKSYVRKGYSMANTVQPDTKVTNNVTLAADATNSTFGLGALTDSVGSISPNTSTLCAGNSSCTTTTSCVSCAGAAEPTTLL